MIGNTVGQCELESILGQGGMGIVYRGRHALLGTHRAVKMLQPHLSHNAEVVHRFLNEARAAASIRHRNIVQVHDCGQLPSGQWFIVLDFIDGGTLRGYIASHGGAVAIHDIVHIVSEIANGLQAAHDHGIVHRDLKPDNIFLSHTEGDPHRVTIGDFGIAKLNEPMAGRVTRTGAIMGTPAYMAPEQLRAERVGPTTDLYALGVITYQMATGGWHPLHDEGSLIEDYARLSAAQFYHRQMSGAVMDPRRYAPALSEAWVRVIYSALEINAEKRPASAREFALRLAEVTPSDTHSRSGTSILRTYAPELLEVDSARETVKTASVAAPPPATITAPSNTRYQIGDLLGSGGMAEVYLGTVLGIEGFARPVVVKRVHEAYAKLPEFADMFITEAKIAARLTHHNIVSVLDFARDGNGQLFLAMEYVQGKDLSALAEAGEVAPAIAAFIVSEMLHGLGYAHECPIGDGARGVVHRDVSPQNVLLSWEGAVKVSDFGIAKALANTGKQVGSAAIRGKPSYMSPEQANGEPLDGRSDLFAVGVVLWELLAGRRLFVGTAKEAIGQVFYREIPPPLGVSTELMAVTMKLLDRDPERRFPFAIDAIEALTTCREFPKNGRSELTRLLAERFPESAGQRPSRPVKGKVKPKPKAKLARRTVTFRAHDPYDREARSAMAYKVPRRWRWAAVAGVMIGAVAAMVGMTAIAQRPTTAEVTTPAALSEPAPAAPAAPATPAAPALEARPAVIEARPPMPVTNHAGSAPTLGADATEAAVGAGASAKRDSTAAAAAASTRRPSASEPANVSGPRGELLIQVHPWAHVWIDGRAYGQTPVRTKLPAGRHQVRLADRRNTKTLTVTISASKSQTIEETW